MESRDPERWRVFRKQPSGYGVGKRGMASVPATVRHFGNAVIFDKPRAWLKSRKRDGVFSPRIRPFWASAWRRFSLQRSRNRRDFSPSAKPVRGLAPSRSCRSRGHGILAAVSLLVSMTLHPHFNLIFLNQGFNFLDRFSARFLAKLLDL